VKYFDHGTVDRNFIERVSAVVYTAWPDGKYRLLDVRCCTPVKLSLLCAFESPFTIAARSTSWSGKTDNFFAFSKPAQE
jgi:hypothetical protein